MKQATAVLIEKASLAVLPLHDNNILSKSFLYCVCLTFYILTFHVIVVTGNGMSIVILKSVVMFI